MIFRVEGVVATLPIERQCISERSLFHAGDAVHAGSKRGEEGAPSAPILVLRRKPRFVVVRVERDFCRDDAIGAETGINLGKLVKAVEHKSGRGDDHDGKCDLRHDKPGGCAEARAFAHEAPAAETHCRKQVNRGHADGGDDAEEQAGEDGCASVKKMSEGWSEMLSMRGVPAGSRRTKIRKLANAAARPTTPARKAQDDAF